ncbi:Lsr2 dimerization domain-containing protein [Glycomyces rhizosphaerae]|uniref:Histone-like nucleoid-structuring protein Lsr2 n=1 Tax=Glycomyces rhizosphaerae TaxID=2054422 RepID=A0ABV7PQX8_9ACTN
MAKKIEVLLIDDIDGTPAESTVRFGLDGFLYQIELVSCATTKEVVDVDS